MADLSWLSIEAKKIHDFFQILFYSLVTVFLLLAIVLEYFRIPLGGSPGFVTLLARTFIAILLLHTYQDISNLIGDLADQFTKELGGFTNIHLVLDKMGSKYHSLTWSWLSTKDSLMLIVSFVGFFLLYFSVHVTEAFILYAWTLLYVFSPVLIALYVFPQTAKATTGLYRSLIEVSLWKMTWAILATLLWSAALSRINDPHYDVSILSALCFNIILAGSLLMTPKIIHMLAGQGISAISGTVGMAAIGAAMVGPLGVAKKGFAMLATGGKLAGAAGTGVSKANRNVAMWRERRKLSRDPYMSQESIDNRIREKFPARKKKT